VLDAAAQDARDFVKVLGAYSSHAPAWERSPDAPASLLRDDAGLKAQTAWSAGAWER
jgi:hypothetical protein